MDAQINQLSFRFIFAAVLLASFLHPGTAASNGRGKLHRQNYRFVAKNRISVLDLKTCRQLGGKVDLSAWNPQMPLYEAIEILRYSAGPRLNIVVLWGRLERDTLISRDTPIGLNGFGNIELAAALKLLLTSVSTDGELGYYVDYGMIIIAPADLVRRKANLRCIYNIDDLLVLENDNLSEWRTGGVNTADRKAKTTENIIQIIRSVRPESWQD
ncbi:MAG: hypothetical protein ABIG61_05980 [Planctomycetota bacterium]